MRESTNIMVRVCDFKEGLVEMVGELKETYPEEVRLHLTEVQLEPPVWGLVESPVGLFVLSEAGELVWLHMVNYVAVPVTPKYRNGGFNPVPKWTLKLSDDVFLNHTSELQNLAKFIRAGEEEDNRYVPLKAVLETSQTAESVTEVESLFKQFKEGSFWSTGPVS